MTRGRIRISCIAVAVALGAGPAIVTAQLAPSFTYQGQLKEGGAPADGSYDFRFRLYDDDDPNSGLQVGVDVYADNLAVNSGLFTAQLDFGAGAFTGDARWLELAVRPGDSVDPYTVLSPRQPLTPAPYALYALDSAGGGSCLWTADPNDPNNGISYTGGNVGVGEQYPWAPLTVVSQGGVEAIAVENWGDGTSASLAGTGTGVSGSTFNPNGAGVYASNLSFDTGVCAAVWAYTPNPNGYAGYFDGRSYFSGDVGVGRIPTAKLDVAGTLKADGFQLTYAPAAGYVLTCDAAGTGTWQPAGAGSSLWTADPNNGISYQSGNVGIGAPSIPNTRLYVDDAATYTIRARNRSTSTTTIAVLAEADSTQARAIFADAAATSGEAVGVWGQSGSPLGYGVHGEAPTTGVRGKATGASGHGVYGYASAASGQTAGVLGEARSPDGYGVFGYNDDDGDTGAAVGVFGETNSGSGVGVKGHAYAPDGFAVVGHNEADTGNAIGVLGQTGHADGFAGYFLGRGYFSGNVGIGTTSLTSKLGVAGVIESLSGGFKFPDGTIQTTAGGGGGGYWLPNGSEIYYDAGNVGVGVSDPQSTFHVAGGNWDVANTEGDFKIGNSTYRLKVGVATDGAGAGTCRVFAGGPSSKLVLGASGQDRLTVTSTDVDITGTLETDGFQLTTSPTAGYVLTCDEFGTGTWQPGGGGGGLTLPYSGTASTASTAFGVTNNGDGMATAIRGTINGATSNDACAGYFRADGCSGYAIYADSSNSTTIRANHNGSVGYAFHGTSDGDGGAYLTCNQDDGFGIKALAIGSWTTNTGGWFEASGNHGNGVYAKSTGDWGCAVQAISEGADGIGLIAKGANTAARLYGDVTLYEYGTETVVLEMGKGLDYAEGFDVSTDQEQIQPGTVLVIDPAAPGELTISTRSYDTKVAGIVAGADGLGSGVRLGGDRFDHNVALAGRVYCNVLATDGPIAPGDLLTTSDVPGYAMKVVDRQRAQGAILGKAMEPLAEGARGRILVLVTLQ